jgi:hypothetical protein
LTSTDEPVGFLEGLKKKNFFQYHYQFKKKGVAFIVLYSDKQFILKRYIRGAL